MIATAGQAPLRLPDTMLRHDIGPYVRSLREYYGLSQQDVAARLHIRLKYVQAIEVSQFEQLPGQVYAKGYVHTYAEFLGLDAEQVVDRCFGEVPVRETQEHFIPAPVRDATAGIHIPKKWTGLAIASVVLFGLYSVISAPGAKKEEIPIAESTAVVPETLLAPMRRAPMATPDNIDCLSGRGRLACFFNSRLTQRWVIPQAAPSYARIAIGNAPAKAKKK